MSKPLESESMKKHIQLAVNIARKSESNEKELIDDLMIVKSHLKGSE